MLLNILYIRIQYNSFPFESLLCIAILLYKLSKCMKISSSSQKRKLRKSSDSISASCFSICEPKHFKFHQSLGYFEAERLSFLLGPSASLGLKTTCFLVLVIPISFDANHFNTITAWSAHSCSLVEDTIMQGKIVVVVSARRLHFEWIYIYEDRS